VSECKVSYEIIYEETKQMGYMQSLERTGEELLEENPHTKELYDHIKSL